MCADVEPDVGHALCQHRTRGDTGRALAQNRPRACVGPGHTQGLLRTSSYRTLQDTETAFQYIDPLFDQRDTLAAIPEQQEVLLCH